MASATRRKSAADELFARVTRLPAAELREFETRFAAWRTNGNGGATAHEITLLQTIQQNSSLPTTQQRRFERLRRRHQSECLTGPEEAELRSLWKRVEQMNVSRLCALVELAQRRGTDVKTLMRECGSTETPDVF